MNNNSPSPDKKAEGGGLKGLIVIIINVFILACVFLLYIRFTSIYQDKLTEENMSNVANLNRSAYTNTVSIIKSWNTKLNDISGYVSAHDMNLEQALDYISQSNSDPNRFFELIGSDYKGYLAVKQEDGTYYPLKYTNISYGALQRIFDDTLDSESEDILFAPEFTDSATAMKFFAIYKHITLRAENGEKKTYTLMLATRSSDVRELLNAQKDYEGQSAVVIDSNGNYIIGNNDFKSDNFLQYIYVYNDLTLDEKNDIQSLMHSTGSGELFYKNSSSNSEECVFRYERMFTNDWYCVTCVPLSSFSTPAFNLTYIIYVIVLLLILFAVDMSWMQMMNRRLRTSMLREIEASQAKGNFMSRMSHEIRTPLNAIIGYNIIARNEISESKNDFQRRQTEMKVMDCLTKSDIASKHLLTIINDVLDMSAIESGKIQVANERFDFKGLISSLTTIFYSQASTKNVDFEVIFEQMTEEWFKGDQMRTNQILTNILSNAVKFTPEGGSVKLVISLVEENESTSRVHFDVVDTGIGMTQEYLERIWTPFEQADSSISRRFGGTGLGLSITKSLVDLMGGTISVKSKPGEGSTFSIELVFERTDQPGQSGAYNFSRINALVVDDDRSTCEYIKLLFDRCTAKCNTVYSGAQALKAMKTSMESGNAYNLCLVDWKMPEMDGLATVEKLREIAGKDLPIIVLTAYDYTEIIDQAAEAGVNKFMSKPLFQSSLFDLLANIGGNMTDEAAPKSKTYDFKGVRILLAEDNKMNMEIARRILESAGLIIDSAWDGQEALAMFENSPVGTYTAVLMDIHMPKMNGHEATRAIRASSHPQAAEIPIIAMTADAFAENVAESKAAGMNDHISKPIDVEVLFDVLGRYIKNSI
ncbi:MAG: response regulator [Eubacteriaceae bacterium]|nr:response regulator [Eubacteriaceae bacterium]